MDTLPLDTNHPAVRDYLALTRLQVLTPLSLVINIASVLVCSAIHPSLSYVSHRWPTALSPNTPIIAIYILALYVMQVGHCVLLVLARKQETKRALVKAVGYSLILSNFVMAIWAIAWVMEWFLFGTILQGILILFLLYSTVTLLVYHPPTSSRPFDTALIHAPLRFFFVLPFALLFPLNLFITLGFVHDGPSHAYNAWHVWPAFGVVLGTNLVGLVVIIFRRDIVWAVAATWICISIWSEKPKPSPIFATVVAFTALHPLALLATEMYRKFHKKQPIALPGDEHRPGVSRPQQERRTDIESEPRELNEDDIWTGSG